MQRAGCEAVRRDKNGLLRAAARADKLAVDKVVAGTAAAAAVGTVEERRGAARVRRTRVKAVSAADAAAAAAVH